MEIWILGCGYTGRRVAERLVAAGAPVTATTRSGQVAVPGVAAVAFDGSGRLAPPEGVHVLHSIPPSAGDVESLLGAAPARVVYLSSTGVYGRAAEVDETTPAAPVADGQRRRFEAEERVRAGPWSTLVLRPAAIYGPDRGVHAAMRAGRYALAGDGSNVTSRIHVDDLADHCVAALRSDLEGAWPVADEHPCPARELAAWCAERFGLPLPPSRDPATLHETLRFTRRVDGAAVRAALGLTLRYPSYREGLAAVAP